MAPATRLNSTKVTSTIKYSSISSKNTITSRNGVYSKRKAENSPPKPATLKNSIIGKNALHSKRKAEHSPPKLVNLKRAALNDLTNNIRFKGSAQPKKPQVANVLRKVDNQLNKGIRVTRSSIRLKEVKTTTTNTLKDACNQVEKDVIVTRRSTRLKEDVTQKVQITANAFQEAGTQVEEVKPTRRSSARLSMSRKSLSADKSLESNSLYISALEDVLNTTKEQDKCIKKRISIVNELSEFDKELLHDPHQVSLYAMGIFQYLKSREAHFTISDYMLKHRNSISEDMRAVLIDWMVEVQENFELNHETLYLAVKLVDMYLDKVDNIEKEVLQLVGVTALFLSCKYDERLSPLLEDFVYVCDGAYKQQDILAMEQNLLKSINYELSVPISYSFLRRYARCARVQMPLLTLARYILELSLMDYRTVTLSDSKLAAASLYLAFRMIDHANWTASLVYYTGYKLDEFKDIVFLFNSIVHKPANKKLMAVRTKYSHELFFNVAKTPLISDEELKKNIDLHS